MVRGFSLMELMIAVAVMAILTVIAYPSYNSYMASAKNRARQTYLEAAQYMERQFTADGNYDGGNLVPPGWLPCPGMAGLPITIWRSMPAAPYTLTARSRPG